MKQHLKALMVAIAFVAGIGGAVVGPAPKVQAAGECGSSYSLIGQHSMLNSSGSKAGTLEVYWSGSNGNNCVIARAYGSNYGVLMTRTVSVQVQGSSTIRKDSGPYRYYAGPVYSTPSSGKCISFGGSFYKDGKFVADKSVINAYCG